MVCASAAHCSQGHSVPMQMAMHCVMREGTSSTQLVRGSCCHAADASMAVAESAVRVDFAPAGDADGMGAIASPPVAAGAVVRPKANPSPGLSGSFLTNLRV
jgi:hypothetical protein